MDRSGIKERVGAVKGYYNQVGINENVGLLQQCCASRLGSSSSRWRIIFSKADLDARISINVLGLNWHKANKASLSHAANPSEYDGTITTVSRTIS